MIRPTKHSHPDRTVISVALVLLAHLKSRRLDGYDELKKLSKRSTAGGDVLFLPALSFLYIMGLVEYRPKTDAFEYVGP